MILDCNNCKCNWVIDAVEAKAIAEALLITCPECHHRWNISAIEIICSLGDDKIFWSPDDDKQTEHAKEQFDDYIKKGFTCFRMDNDGNKAGRKITKFPAHAARLLFVPRAVGG